jgi:hypothetical protein
MSKRDLRRLVTFYVLLGLLGALYVVSLFRGEAHAAALGAEQFSAKPAERLVLPPASDSRLRQIDHYQSDGISRKDSHIEYRDGAQEEVHFRADGTRSDSVRFFGPDNEGKRRVKSRATYDASGKLFATHDVYRFDGTLERQGHLLADGTYEHRYFFDDGKTVERIRLFDKAKQFGSENLYRLDGTLATQMSRIGSELQVKQYDSGQNLTARYAVSVLGLQGELLNADGSVRARFLENKYASEAEYFNSKGVLVQRLSRTIGSFGIVALDGNGLFRQTWREVRSPDGTAALVLRRVEEWRADRTKVRTIQMSKDGLKPIAVEYDQRDQSTLIKTLADDGKTVVSVAKKSRAGDTLWSRHSSNQSEKFIGERMKMPEQTALPSVRYVGPPRIYDYDPPEQVKQ